MIWWWIQFNAANTLWYQPNQAVTSYDTYVQLILYCSSSQTYLQFQLSQHMISFSMNNRHNTITSTAWPSFINVWDISLPAGIHVRLSPPRTWVLGQAQLWRIPWAGALCPRGWSREEGLDEVRAGRGRHRWEHRAFWLSQ